MSIRCFLFGHDWHMIHKVTGGFKVTGDFNDSKIDDDKFSVISFYCCSQCTASFRNISRIKSEYRINKDEK